MAVDTKELILNTAERLFAEQGIDAVSLRTIIAEAGVNLAAIHYHFGSKELLVKEVFARRVMPLNQERLAMLDQCEASAGSGPLPVENVLRALFEPAIRLTSDAQRGHIFLRLCGRFWAEIVSQRAEMFDDLFKQVIERFESAFRRALPDLPAKEMFWRTHFAVGAMVHTMMDSERLQKISGGLCDSSNVEEAVEQMVRYAAAGLKAPVLEPPANQEEKEMLGVTTEGA